MGWFVYFLLISWQPLGFKCAIPLFNEQYSLTIAGSWALEDSFIFLCIKMTFLTFISCHYSMKAGKMAAL